MKRSPDLLGDLKEGDVFYFPNEKPRKTYTARNFEGNKRHFTVGEANPKNSPAYIHTPVVKIEKTS